MVQLICSDCGGPLARSEVAFSCPDCRTEIPIRDGIVRAFDPSSLHTVEPKPETSQFLQSVKSGGWASAFYDLQASSPEKASEVYRSLFDPKRTVGSYFLPITSASRALEISYGIEGITRSLARTCEEVVSVDRSLDRLLSDRALYEFEKLKNIVQIHAGWCLGLPMASHQFDIVVLNGVIEGIPHMQSGNPRETQLRFLREVSRVLRPEGVVMVGVANRFAYRNIRPGRVAELFSRWRKNKPHRTHTHSFSGYERLFRDAGLNAVRLLPVEPDHRFPSEVHDLISRGGRRYPTAHGVSLKERIRKSPPFLRHFSGSFLIFASPRPPLPDSLLDDVTKRLKDHSGMGDVHLRRFTTSAAGALALFAGDGGDIFLRIGQARDQVGRMARNAKALNTLEGILSSDEPETPRVPGLLLDEHRGGHFFTAEEGLPGISCQALMRGGDREAALDGMSDVLIDFGRRTLSAEEAKWTQFREGLARRFSELGAAMVDERCRSKLGTLADEMGGEILERGRATVWTHGDFNPGNCLWDEKRSRVSGVIDWDQCMECAPPGLDLISLFLSLRPQFYRGDRILDLLEGRWTHEEETLWRAYHSALGVTSLGRALLIKIGWINSAWNGFHNSIRRLDYAVVSRDVCRVVDHIVG